MVVRGLVSSVVNVRVYGGPLMVTRKTVNLPARLEGTRRRFERWRRTRTGHSRIPESLWVSAVKAARQYGLNRAARVLGLDYNALKKRVEATGSGSMSDRGAVATFVELAPSASGSSYECILELEDPGGAQMRVHLKGVGAPDLAALSRSFWGVEP
jgi:hypothetical protein